MGGVIAEFAVERCKADPENIISLDWLLNYIDEIIRQLPQYKKETA